jgi:hypothetical protein
MSYQHGGETSTCALASASLDLILIFGVAWGGCEVTGIYLLIFQGGVISRPFI